MRVRSPATGVVGNAGVVLQCDKNHSWYKQEEIRELFRLALTLSPRPAPFL